MAGVCKQLLVFVHVTGVLMFPTILSGEHTDMEDENPIKSYHMSDFCALTLNMTERHLDELIIELTHTDNYPANMDCLMTIVTSRHHKLLFDFLYMQLHSCDDRLALYGNSVKLSEALTSEICRPPHDVTSSPDNKAILRFRSSSSGGEGGFKILVTSYYTTAAEGECKSDDHTCDNGRCVSSDLVCNSRNNCGDDSDERCEDDEWWWWFYIVVGGVGVIVCTGLYSFCRLLNKSKMTANRQVPDNHAGYPLATPCYPHQSFPPIFTVATNQTIGLTPPAPHCPQAPNRSQPYSHGHTDSTTMTDYNTSAKSSYLAQPYHQDSPMAECVTSASQQTCTNQTYPQCYLTMVSTTQVPGNTQLASQSLQSFQFHSEGNTENGIPSLTESQQTELTRTVSPPSYSTVMADPPSYELTVTQSPFTTPGP